MYRALVDSRMKCCDPPGSRSHNKLKRALKKLFCDICETLISYRHGLEISGTIGITVDRESVLLLQFNEAFQNGKPTTPVFHEEDDDDDEGDDNDNNDACGSNGGTSSAGNGSSKGAKEKGQSATSPLSSSAKHPKDHQNAVQRSSSSNNTPTDGDQRSENVSKNGGGSNSANSGDSSNCPVGVSNVEEKKPPVGESSIPKSDAPAVFARNTSEEVSSQVKPVKRNTSMLSQLLQRPPSNSIETYGSSMNHVWPAPVSASEMLKKLSNRVDCPTDHNGSRDVKTSGKMKSESVCCPSASQRGGKSSPCSSYLKELLFKKASGQQDRQRVSQQRAGATDKKRKRTGAESEVFFPENGGREENGSDSFRSFVSYQFAPLSLVESGPFPGFHQNIFPVSMNGTSPNLSSEFPEYQYSRMLHKLVRQTDSTRACNGSSEIQEGVVGSNNNNNNNQERPFGILDMQGARRDFECHSRTADNWTQAIKTEVADGEILESPMPLIRFDTGSGNHPPDAGRGADQ